MALRPPDPAPSAQAIALNRLGLGARPDDSPPANPQRWLLDQLDRYQARPPAWAAQRQSTELLAGYQSQQRQVREASEADRQAMRQALRKDARADYAAAVQARLASALDTPSPFVERLVHFWSNHFAISVEKPQVLALAGAYEVDAIRPHVLGRFEDLLLAAVRHPAMLVYLDQAQSVGPDSPAARRFAERNPQKQPRGLNENLAREILELHTLGVRSGYSQDDVTEFARALTGWSLAGLGPAGAPAMEAMAPDAAPGGFQFRPAMHEPGTRTLMGRSYGQAGEAQALAILHDLAASPATARHVSTKLAIHFVADDPPRPLVDHLAAAYLASDGSLPAVYRALAESPQTWAGRPGKFKSPWDWMVSSMRGLGAQEAEGVLGAQWLNQLGQPVWRPGSPAGFDDLGASWAAPDALLRRVELAQRLAARWGQAADPRVLAPRLLPGGALSDATATAIARAESPGSGLALLLVSPDFLRR